MATESDTMPMEEAKVSGSDGVAGVDITPDQDGGVLKEIKRVGEGEESPLAGDKVFVHYVGTLLDGSKFDSSRDRNEKFEFNLGRGSVIKAWDIGVATMKKGEMAVFICKPQYAYGETGSPPKIPPNATLVFEVELFEWRGEDLSEDKDEGILRSTIEKGEGYQTPNDGANVEIHITGSYNGKVFEDRDVQYIQGEGSEQGLVDGVELALKRFKKGEKSRLKVKSEYAYGSVGNQEKGIPPFSDLEYVIFVKNFEKVKESWEMDSDEKLEQAEIVKTKGTNYFKASKFQLAKKYYQKIVDYLEHETGLEDEPAAKREALLLAGHLNMAMTLLKLEDYSKASEHCDKALEFDANNEKGFFRRGQAKLNMQDYGDAINDFERVLTIDPNNKAAKNLVIKANQKIKQEQDREKKLYAGMFRKFAEEDSKKVEVIQDAFQKVGEWSNEMAQGIMPLDQEVEAFGEKMPEPKYTMDQQESDKENMDDSF